MSTLRCYYHNVAELKKNPDGLFQYGWFKYGYKKLWIELAAHEMNKSDLVEKAGISWSSVTKMAKNENVSMEVLKKICKALQCNVGDILDILPEDTEE